MKYKSLLFIGVYLLILLYLINGCGSGTDVFAINFTEYPDTHYCGIETFTAKVNYHVPADRIGEHWELYLIGTLNDNHMFYTDTLDFTNVQYNIEGWDTVL